MERFYNGFVGISAYNKPENPGWGYESGRTGMNLSARHGQHPIRMETTDLSISPVRMTKCRKHGNNRGAGAPREDICREDMSPGVSACRTNAGKNPTREGVGF